MKVNSVFSGPEKIKLPYRFKGTLIALGVILGWLSLLAYGLLRPVTFSDPWLWLQVLVQMHLFTGLFITAHDGMHHLISSSRNTNHGYGILAASLFMFNNYKTLYQKHHQHHLFPATETDPDYSTGSFWVWYFRFIRQYVSIWQILGVAILFNLLAVFFNQENLILFWVVPSVLSTVQLFVFGTYLPHRNPERLNNPHKARSLQKNHLLAFFSCYFFGYHYEHHDKPFVPWWLLWKEREKSVPE